MLESIDPLTLARRYHDAMPLRIREYLNHRGIIDEVIDLHLLGWNGERITIPIFDRNSRLVFFKLAKDPEDRTLGPKMLAPAGTKAELYGWERLQGKPPRIVICEGEFDRLALESRGIATVTSTGGAGVFRKEWAECFREIPEVYLCFDRDSAGTRGALRIGKWLPQARIVELPEEVGPGGDVTDYFVRLEGTRDDFLRLLEQAKPVPAEEGSVDRQPPDSKQDGDRSEVESAKAGVRIEEVVCRFLKLAPSGRRFRARCPFHEDHIPSFVLYPESQSFYCFGCGARGDVLDFLMQVEKISFRRALDRLRSRKPHSDERAA